MNLAESFSLLLEGEATKKPFDTARSFDAIQSRRDSNIMYVLMFLRRECRVFVRQLCPRPHRGVAAFGLGRKKKKKATSLRYAHRVSFLSQSAGKYFQRRCCCMIGGDGIGTPVHRSIVFERYELDGRDDRAGTAPRKETVSNGFLEARSKRNARDQVLINLSIVLAKPRGERRERR